MGVSGERAHSGTHPLSVQVGTCVWIAWAVMGDC